MHRLGTGLPRNFHMGQNLLGENLLGQNRMSNTSLAKLPNRAPSENKRDPARPKPSRKNVPRSGELGKSLFSFAGSVGTLNSNSENLNAAAGMSFCIRDAMETVSWYTVQW